MRFSTEEKIKALQRELALRRAVYARRVEEGKMTREQAEYEISIFEDILNDYAQVFSHCASEKQGWLF